MGTKSKTDELSQRCRELEVSVRLWVAANNAKAERITELEALCSRLQQRVARLSRQVGRRRATPLEQARAREG